MSYVDKYWIDRYVTTGILVNNYAHIFDLLTHLRQILESN